MPALRTLAALLLLVPLAAPALALDDDVEKLEPGHTATHEIAAGATLEIRIKVKRKRAADVVVESDGGLVITLVGPEGDELDGSLPGPFGTQDDARMIAVGGKHLLRLRPYAKGGGARVTVRVGEARKATAADLGLVEAGRLSLESQKLLNDRKSAEALPLVERELALRERAVGLDDVALLGTLYRLSSTYQELGQGEKAVAVDVRSIAILDRARGPNAAAVENALTRSLESALTKLVLNGLIARDFVRADGALARLLALADQRGDDAMGADLLSMSANVAAMRNDERQFEERMVQAIARAERAHGAESPPVARLYLSLATGYARANRLDDAARAAERAAGILERLSTPDIRAELSMMFGLLEVIYKSKGDAAKVAETQARLERLGPAEGKPSVLDEQMKGIALLQKGDSAGAAEVLERSLAAAERSEDVVGQMTPLSLLSPIYIAQKDYVRAERVLLKAIAFFEKNRTFGEIVLPGMRSNLAMVYRTVGDIPRATALQRQANDAVERTVARTLVAGSERQRLLLLEQTAFVVDRSVSLHLASAPTSPEAAALALEVVLQRKGRALDASADAVEVLRRRGTGEERALLDRLAGVRADYATASGATPPDPKRIAELERAIDDLEAAVGAKSAEYRATFRPVALAGVRDAIPEGAALVELASYGAVEPGSGEFSMNVVPPPPPRRYAAYVLVRGGEPRGVDLGPAEEIDAAVDRLRAALRDPKREDVVKLARELDERVMRPVRALAGAREHLLVSPDGALNLVPFAALVDEDGHYLVERYLITYLTSGRDLARLGERFAPRSKPLVVADPDYGTAATAEDRRLEHTEAGLFRRLPGTAGEARALARLAPDATVLVAGQATEAAVKRVDRPAFVHLATHGFFLTAPLPAAAPPDPSRDITHGASSTAAPPGNPLLRSGLAFANANLRAAGPEDGILTALEATGLDLWGTRLVVLSACDTGVGEVRSGDGVYGLRRALVLAGSESQVMSLWPVSDRATGDLMVAYYEALFGGAGRGEALRRVQRRMLAEPATRHPYYWAPFIQSGAWSAL
jgi:CHAT domain-containing protein